MATNGATTKRITIASSPKTTLIQNRLFIRESEIFFRWMIADDVPKSLNIPTNPMTIVAIPTKPKSDGDKRRARTAVVTNCIICRLTWEIEDHLTPDIEACLRDIRTSSPERCTFYKGFLKTAMYSTVNISERSI